MKRKAVILSVSRKCELIKWGKKRVPILPIEEAPFVAEAELFENDK